MGSLRSLRRREVQPVVIPVPSDTEVFIAASYPGNPKQVQGLLTRGGNPNAVDNFGESALQSAASCNRIGVVRLLLDHGANSKYRDSLGRGALHSAATGGPKRSLATSRLLLDHGADINAVDNNGWTPLMLAVAWRNNVELVRLLLARGADPNVRNSEDKRAVDLIMPGKNEDALKSLLEPVS